jgi:hypothetical protein
LHMEAHNTYTTRMYIGMSMCITFGWLRKEKSSLDDILDHYDEYYFLFEHLMRCYKHVLRLERLLLMVPMHGQNGLVCPQLEKEF